MSSKNLNIIGLGYIGLPTALMFAASGVKVTGTDYNVELVNLLSSGKVSFDEKGLPELFEKAKENMEYKTEYIKTSMYIIAVPTPYNVNTKQIDASYVCSAVEKVAEVCKDDAIIIIESTVSPGTIDNYVRPIIKNAIDTYSKNINIVHAPERIIPGNMIYELKHNSRTIGADKNLIGEKVKELYSTICKGEIIVTDIRTAEMTKVVENTFRDINIAFANELLKICRSDGMDVHEIIKIANKHPRVNILSPGPGVGGHCISVDPWFLVGDYPQLTNLILAARKVNDSMPEFVLSRIYSIMQENKISDVSRVGLYGLTYKENVDDTRESPTLQLIESMKKHLAGNEMKFYDPFIKEDIVENQYHSLDEFIQHTDIIVIMVGHNEIIENQIKLKDKIVLDTKNSCKDINTILL